MAGTIGGRRNQSGGGHGARNHRHASGNRVACYYYATFHVRWRPEPIEPEKQSRHAKGKSRHAKNKLKRRKQ